MSVSANPDEEFDQYNCYRKNNLMPTAAQGAHVNFRASLNGISVEAVPSTTPSVARVIGVDESDVTVPYIQPFGRRLLTEDQALQVTYKIASEDDAAANALAESIQSIPSIDQALSESISSDLGIEVTVASEPPEVVSGAGATTLCDKMNQFYVEDRCEDTANVCEMVVEVPVNCLETCEEGGATCVGAWAPGPGRTCSRQNSLTCEHDSSTYNICRCGPKEPVCPQIMCPTPCDDGFVVDENGCTTCECNPPVCPQIMCRMHCEDGFVVDENGCTTCECNPPVDPPEATLCDKMNQSYIEDRCEDTANVCEMVVEVPVNCLETCE